MVGILGPVVLVGYCTLSAVEEQGKSLLLLYCTEAQLLRSVNSMGLLSC